MLNFRKNDYEKMDLKMLFCPYCRFGFYKVFSQKLRL